MRNLLSLFIILLLFFGCSQQNESILSSNNNPGGNEVDALLKPPAQSGPYVMRYDAIVAFLFSDAKTGLTATLGVDNALYCSGQFAFDLLPLQEIDSPADVNRFINLQKGDVQTEIYEGVFLGGNLCDFFSANPLLATGTSSIVLTDNDLLAYLPHDNVNSNAFGIQAHGELTTTTGEIVKFTGISRSVWDGVDPGSFKSSDHIFLK